MCVPCKYLALNNIKKNQAYSLAGVEDSSAGDSISRVYALPNQGSKLIFSIC